VVRLLPGRRPCTSWKQEPGRPEKRLPNIQLEKRPSLAGKRSTQTESRSDTSLRKTTNASPRNGPLNLKTLIAAKTCRAAGLAKAEARQRSTGDPYPRKSGPYSLSAYICVHLRLAFSAVRTVFASIRVNLRFPLRLCVRFHSCPFAVPIRVDSRLLS
jgi:hypothetical protein